MKIAKVVNRKKTPPSPEALWRRRIADNPTRSRKLTIESARPLVRKLVVVGRFASYYRSEDDGSGSNLEADISEDAVTESLKKAREKADEKAAEIASKVAEMLDLRPTRTARLPIGEVAVQQLDIGGLNTGQRPVMPAFNDELSIVRGFRQQGVKARNLPARKARYTDQFPWHGTIDDIPAERMDRINSPRIRPNPRTGLNFSTVANAVRAQGEGDLAYHVMVMSLTGSGILGLELPDGPSETAGAAFLLSGVDENTGSVLQWDRIIPPIR